MELVDPDAIHAARDALRRRVGAALADELGGAQAADRAGDDLSPEAKGVRRLRSVALALLAAGDPARGAALAKAQYDAADNMTDRQGALAVLASLDGPSGRRRSPISTLAIGDDALVIDKWFALQAAAQRPDTLTVVEGARPPSRLQLEEPQPLARAGRQLRRQPMGLPRRVGARLPLGRRPDHRGRRASTRRSRRGWCRRSAAGGGSVEPRRADARRTGADRRDAGPEQGRVRAGVEEPGLNG